MQRAPATIEEQLIVKAIAEECQWDSLPKRLQSTLNSKEEWHRRVIEHCIKKRLLWNSCFARKVCKEGEYYEEMMRYLRRNLALFLTTCGLPNSFYNVFAEQPYDSIPNFSAADALRLTGIGRNEFIDIMNKCRSKKLSEEETATIDKICKEEANSFILFDPEIIKGLYRRGLVYFDVPVYADDRFKVSRLEGFVSNREQLYEDPIEELLYAVFVVSSENSTVAELATTLQADISQLQAAASFACRLGWAVKLIDPASILQESNAHGSPKGILGDEEDGAHANMGSSNLSSDGTSLQPGDILWTDNSNHAADCSRVAFVVDANITSYLMMGSVSPGLKSHAVTLYEAGKLGHASIADLCRDLVTLESAKFEGELQEFANHAFSLRCILECLTSGGIVADGRENIGSISLSKEEATSFTTDVCYGDKSTDSGMNRSESNLEDHEPLMMLDGNVSAEPSTERTIDENLSTTLSEESNSYAEDSKLGLSSKINEKSHCVEATLDRLFHRDYDIIMSMIPLPHSSVLPGPKGPIHFGPPSHSSMTSWMKLVLYSALSSGPLSVVLMKGQCLRLLPAPLAGCEKALVWSWDGSTIGGLGGKLEGNLVKGSILLHCLNSLLKCTAVLVQPLSRYDLDDGGKVVTLDVPLPLKNSDGSMASIGEELGLSREESLKLNMLLHNISNKINLWTMGYIRLLRLFKEGQSENFSVDTEKYEWVPLSAEFEYQATGPTAKLLYQKEHQKDKDSSRELMTYASGRWNPLSDPSSPISGALSENQRLKLANRQRCRTEVLSFDGNILRSYSLSPVYEATTRPLEDSVSIGTAKGESEDGDSKEVILPGVNLLFDGSELHPFEIGACLQARQPVSLIAEASAASASLAVKQKV
ncbi:UNVERIFIED_CONTAM: protein FAM91A1 [Sesamum radiatum]|uniref:Protein FAM91A1 n=1 Tax=Sesamum radiatum TaxID=300843 RepID=A0AAW2Q239_SESRA